MSIMRRRLQIAELCNTGMLYRRVIDNLPHRISVKDVTLAYVSCNEAYARDLNIKPGEIQGKRDYDFFPKELAEKNITEENEILISGVKREKEEKYMVSGKELTVLATKTPIKYDDGVIIGLQIVLQDITQDKRRAESLVSLNKNLEDLLVQGEEKIDALKLDLERMTVQRNQLEAEIKNMQESMKKQEKKMAIRDAKIEKLKNDLQRETKEQKHAVKLLKKSFTQIQNLVNSAQYLTVLSRSEEGQ
jgi:PAS domain S-box-containing protein